MSEVFRVEKEIAGRKLILETGKVANQASGSCVATYGDTSILATAVISNQTREGLDFFPLTVEFEERFYAAGRIKGSRFIKREGRPTDEAVLNGRMVDRAIRPLFDENIRNEVQVILTVLSIDNENESKLVALIAASAALSLSNIPWAGPIAGVCVGDIDGALVINPTIKQLENSPFELVIAGTREKVIMVEAEAQQVSESKMLEAFSAGQKVFGPIIDLIDEIVKLAGKEKSNIMDLVPKENEETLKKKEEVMQIVDEFISEKVNPYLLAGPKPTKALRKHGLHELTTELYLFLVEKGIEADYITYAVNKAPKLIEEKVSAAIVEREVRVDGRKLNEIRALSGEVGIYKRLHGSALFSRGETQVFSVVTLGSPGDVQLLDTMETVGEKRYMHFYNFMPFSVGEVKPLRGVGRREIGHGALAEKALKYMIPAKEDFPYTIMVVSETLSSNGSSSMASTCGSTLALMDAGVPIKNPVAGIAMGLATDKKGHYKILTDIQDLEDGPGGMDFKITGTQSGITAIQMDTKSDGLTLKMVEETLSQGREALNKILAVFAKTIAEPRRELSPYAPRITSFYIDVEKIKDVIGPGGKVINEIIRETGVSIDIDEHGLVLITTADSAMGKKAEDWVKMIVKVPEVGEIYDGTVVRLMEFGAFVEILPGKDGMIHISKLAPQRVNHVTDVVQMGDKVKVKVIEIDEKGRINLALLEGGRSLPADYTFTGNDGGGFGGGGFGGRGGRGGFGGRGRGGDRDRGRDRRRF